MKRYFQQIRYQFRTQPMILIISVVGTALSIAFVMLFLQKRQVYLTPLAPESNRERTLHIVELLSRGESPGNLDLDALMLGGRLVRECFYPLQTAEAVTAYTSVAYGQGSLFSAQAGHISLPDGKKRQGSRMKGTDAAFWKVFDFSFIHGKPYTAAEFDAALPLAVIDEHVAYSLWGTTDVVGREFKMKTLLPISGKMRRKNTVPEMCMYGLLNLFLLSGA